MIPDTALVVRGGQNRPEDIDIGTDMHPSGIYGASVQCADGLTVEQLAAALPQGRIGVTTVGEVRAAGGDVIRTSGGSPHHATLTGISSGVISWLLTPTIPHPAGPGRRRRKP